LNFRRDPLSKDFLSYDGQEKDHIDPPNNIRRNLKSDMVKRQRGGLIRFFGEITFRL